MGLFFVEGGTRMSFKVHIDPGHYSSNYNQSPVNRAYYESVMTWKLSGFLKTALESKGITVTMSRSSMNQNPSLYNRGYGAKGCDLFLSMHSNACDTEIVDHPVVYRGYDKNEADEFALQLAQIIHQTLGTREAGRTATRKGTNGEYYGVMYGARAAGLKYYYIVEHSFHTNTRATNWLLNDSNLKALAQKEANLIASYFNVSTEDSKSAGTHTQPVSPGELYRIRKSWNDTASQIGAYSSLDRAKKAWKAGYYVFDSMGNVLYPIPSGSSTSSNVAQGIYQVRLLDDLNIRKTPNGQIVQVNGAKKGFVYTIVETQGNWGRLKSGAGWISVSDRYVKRV